MLTAIPDRCFEQHQAILGKTGSGKTYTAKGMVERLLAKKQRVCVLDPTSAWWGLRSAADGEQPGFPIVVFGGEHGDVAIDRQHGQSIAEIVATTDTSTIIDVRTMTVGERTQFRGCSMAKGSETGGCKNCYAARMAARNLPEMKSPTTGKPFARILESGPRWTGEVELIEHKLLDPFAWKRPRRVFVNSMSDLFHESLNDDDIERVFAVMALNSQHTFQILTKRPERMHAFLTREYHDAWIEGQTQKLYHALTGTDPSEWLAIHGPLPNVWLGTSVENQATADARIPWLLRSPAAIRFISYEPALGPVDFHKIPWDPIFNGNCPKLDWIIAGGESGPQARPAHPDWFRLVRDQCAAGGVAFFFKQWGEYASVSEVEGGGMHHIFPCGATVRRVGTSKAGRTLDGKEYSQFPKVIQPDSSAFTK